ncbi:hypothetical protein [Streptomyces sp. CC228A]|uniref:hypothetical protein n=1 Tax=Streptomyces sp. CC228A TaxID=2898186 RepID=UPI001F401841|nr:hypothetical protein [Streptomyces sp. CC228A]
MSAPRELLAAAGMPGGRRTVSLLATDHWYDSSRLWSMVSGGARPGVLRRLPAYCRLVMR